MTPDFHIVVDGRQDITAAIRERLLSLRVSDEEGYKSDAVEIRLDDRGGTVELGYSAGGELAGLDSDSGRVPMGRYTVDEVELSGPPATLVVRAKAADMREALKQRRTRAWSGVLLGGLVRTVAGRYGIDPRVSSGLAKITLPPWTRPTSPTCIC